MDRLVPGLPNFSLNIGEIRERLKGIGEIRERIARLNAHGVVVDSEELWYFYSLLLPKSDIIGQQLLTLNLRFGQ